MISGQNWGDLAFRSVKSELDQLMQKRGVSEQTRANILICADLMYQYIDYARTQRKDPTDRAVLAKFLAGKSKDTVKLFGNEGLNCGLSIVEFLLSAGRAGSAAGSGNPPLVALTLGFALLDLIEVGNSCEAAQRGYYEAFLKQSSVRLTPIRVRVQQHYNTDKQIRIHQGI